MDTGSSFLGGGWGGNSGALGQALGGPQANGYSSGLLNQGGGFGARATPFVADNGQALGQQYAYTLGAGAAQAKSAAELQAAQNAAETQRARIAARAQDLPARLANQRFNSVFGQTFPLFKSTLAGLQNGNFGFGAGGPGGASGQPTISAAPVYTPQQTQAQINLQTSQNDAQTAGNIRQIQQQTAGRGFGANSPLAQALAGQAQVGNQATNTANATNTYTTNAKLNSDHVLAAQQAQEAQWADLANAQTERAKLPVSTLNTLLASLGSFGR